MASIEDIDGSVEMKHLVSFLEVARSMSFTRAAEELGYVQSSVTSHIKTLESDLGIELFERLGRRIVLSPQPTAPDAHAAGSGSSPKAFARDPQGPSAR